MSIREKFIRRVAAAIPHPLAVAPERVLLNLVVALIGVVVLLSRSLVGLWPGTLGEALGVVMALGGTAAVVGYWAGANVASPRPRAWMVSLERAGYLAVLLATLPFGVRLIDAYGWRGVPIGLIFFGIAVAKAIRLLVSTAARDEVLRSGEDQES